MLGISFKLDEVTGYTTLRFSKKLYKEAFIKFLKEKEDFEFLEKNRINCVFKYRGSVENAEFNFNIHYVTFKNLNNRISIERNKSYE
jgi:hypothetical protein